MVTPRMTALQSLTLTWALLSLVACGEDSIVSSTDVAVDVAAADQATTELTPTDAADTTQAESDAAESDVAHTDTAETLDTATDDTATDDTAIDDTASDGGESDTAQTDAAEPDVPDTGSDAVDAQGTTDAEVGPDVVTSDVDVNGDTPDAPAAGTDVLDQTDTEAASDASPDVVASDSGGASDADAGTDAVASDAAANTDGTTDTTSDTDASAAQDTLDPADQEAGSDASAASDMEAAADAITQADEEAGGDASAPDDAEDALEPECVGATDCLAPTSPCQIAVCNPDGTCGTAPTPTGAPCDDGSACTEGDACSAGTCVGTAIICDDGNPCTLDGCLSESGCGIALADDATPCDDGDACSESDACAGGVCKGSPVLCDDGNSCTNDTCAPASGCVLAPDPTATCSDDDACTVSDKCEDGVCVTTALSCDDNQPCTLDSCEAGICQHTELPGCFAIPCASDLDCPSGSCDLPSHTCRQCNTDVDCGPGAWCSAHVCMTGTPCSSDTQCKATDQVCHPTQGVCVDCASAGDCATEQACVESTCVAAKPCTSSKQCAAVCDTAQGVCVECLGSADCPTNTWCDTTGHVCRPDVCVWTECQGAKAFACLTDGSGYAAPQACTTANPCLSAACEAKTGCYTDWVVGPCSDGDACTLGDACAGGACQPGAQKSCSDGNACTVDSVCQTGACPAYVSTVSLLAGSGASAYANGTGAAAAFSYVRGLAIAADGTVYVADNSSIRKVTTDGVVALHAGGASTGFADGPLGTGKFSGAWGLALAPNGDLYVTDWNNNRVRKVTPDGTISTVAGSGESGFQDGPAQSAKFNSPSGILVEPDGGLLVAEYGGARIRRIKDGVVSTVAGTGTKGTADGPALQAQFHTPGFLLRSPQGHIYVSDVETDRIRKLSATGVVTTLAGGTQGYQNGTGSNARFDAPEQMAWISDSEFLVGELLNHRIRKVTVYGEVSLYAGTGTASSVSGPLSTATFNQPVGLARGPGGVLYLTENASNLVRRIVPKDVNCADDDACTLDFCSPIDGCGHTPAMQCDDGDPCTEGDGCVAGACAAGTPVNCDDNNPCTTDTCGPSGCVHAKLDAGTSCGSGLTCNNLGACTCGNNVCEMGEHCCQADCGICGPSWYWNAVDLNHKYGVAENGGWKCTTKICSGKDHMVYGPDATFLGPGTYKATFQFKASPECNSLSCSNTYLADMDVCIDDGLTILASGKVMYVDIQAGISDNWWTERSLTFTITGQATAEFRVRWNAGGGDTAKLVVGQIRVDKL